MTEQTEWVYCSPEDAEAYGSPYAQAPEETRARRSRAGHAGTNEFTQPDSGYRLKRSARFASAYITETPPSHVIDDGALGKPARERRSDKNASLHTQTAMANIPVAFEISGNEQSSSSDNTGLVSPAASRPIVRVEMANDVLIGPPGERFDNVRIHSDPDDSCSKKGYVLSDPRNKRISYLSAVKDGVTLPAYCLNFFLDAPHGTSHDSGTLEAGVAATPAIRCAIAWVLANGYGRGTVMSEWNTALGVTGLDADDARFITAAAIWMIQKQLDPNSYFVADCPRGPTPDPAHLAMLNAALTRFIQLAEDYGNANPDCGSGGYDINCRPVDDPEAPPQPPPLPPDDIQWTYLEMERAATGCGTGSLPISICYHDSEKVKWSKFPDIIRLVCGKVMIGPFRFEGDATSASGDAPEVTLDVCCECSNKQSFDFADSCGNKIARPSPGEDFFIRLRINGRFMCFTICIGYVEWATHVWFIITPGNRQNVGTRQKCKVMIRDSEKGCMHVCFTLWDQEPLPLPAPMPVFYPQCPPPPPCELPPQIITSPPSVTR